MDMDMHMLHVYICLSVSSTSTYFNDVMYVYVTLPVMWSNTILHGLFIIFYCNQYGWTAMIRAAYEGHKDIVEYLVGQGADKDTMSNVSTYLVDVH